MENTDNNEPPKKKRGPYKQYAMYGNASAVPRSTQHDRRNSARNSSTVTMGRKSTEERPDDTVNFCTEDSEGHPNIEMTETTQVLPRDGIDDTTINYVGLQGSENSDMDEFSSQSDGGGTGTSQINDGRETALPEEAYTKTFLTEMLLIFATKLRHNLTYTAAEDVIRLLQVMGHSRSLDKANKYHWKKLLRDFSTCMAVHHICDECHVHAGAKSTGPLQCNNCGKVVDSENNLKSNNAFIYISLTYQLREIFETTSAHSTCQKRRVKECVCAYEDICDGDLYKLNVAENMLSINFSVDGVPVFDSSGFSIYPILCSINELHPRERKKYVLLCGLWFGIGKPLMNEYLKPFVAEAQALYNHGFTYVYDGITYTKKCCVLAGVCDSVARPMLRNSTQFNGKYGCGLCLHTGEVIEKGQGTVRVYPISDDGNPFGEGLRTHDGTLRHAQNQELGIKGRSILNDIPNFDIICCLDVDWMHAVPLGVCRQFAKLWFDTANHKEDFYFGNRIRDIDKRIRSYNPTVEVSRTPREMSDRAHWKAHEWVVFLLFYSIPILHEYFPTKYVAHWALLVDAIQILTKTSIRRSEIICAERCLIEFIRNVEKLYGRQHLSFNVHLLAHLGKSVEKLGPLWTHSAFIYENANQELLNYIKSSNGVAMQICDAIRTKCVVDRLNYICRDHLNTAQKEYLHHILNKSQKPKPKLILENACMLGAPTLHETLSDPHRLAFERADIHIDPMTTVRSYKRLTINGELVHSVAYKRVEKRCNYIVRLINSEIFEIQLFYVVTIDATLRCYALGRYFKKENKPLIPGRRLDHLIVLTKNSSVDLVIVRVSEIKEKVILLEMSHLQRAVACVHPNHFEVLL